MYSKTHLHPTFLGIWHSWCVLTGASCYGASGVVFLWPFAYVQASPRSSPGPCHTGCLPEWSDILLPLSENVYLWMKRYVHAWALQGPFSTDTRDAFPWCYTEPMVPRTFMFFAIEIDVHLFQVHWDVRAGSSSDVVFPAAVEGLGPPCERPERCSGRRSGFKAIRRRQLLFCACSLRK